MVAQEMALTVPRWGPAVVLPVEGDESSTYSLEPNWRPVHERAAFATAEDVYTDKMIAKRLGIGEVTLWRWRKDPHFKKVVAYYRERLLEHVWTAGIAQKSRRITILDNRHRALEQIIAERVDWFADHAPDVPGGQTGLLVRKVKLDQQGNEVVEYEVDTSLLREEKRILEHVAREKGEWVEKNVNLNANVDLNDDDLDPAVLAAVRAAMTGQAAHLGLSASQAPPPGSPDTDGSAT